MKLKFSISYWYKLYQPVFVLPVFRLIPVIYYCVQIKIPIIPTCILNIGRKQCISLKFCPFPLSKIFMLSLRDKIAQRSVLAAFLTKMYQLVDDLGMDNLISWVERLELYF